MKPTHRMRLVGLMVAEASAVVLLHGLSRLDGFSIGWSDLPAWLDETPFEDAAGAMILLVALVLAYWLLISTLSYAVASRSGNPSAIRMVGWLTLPAVRRLTSRAVALSLAASSVAGPLAPAIANLGSSGSAEVIVEVDAQGRIRPPGLDAAQESESVLPPHLTAPPEQEPAGPVSDAAAVTVDGTVDHRVTVRRGDHLWSLSERHLERVHDRIDLGEHEIARYWVRVIEANRSTIRSGNPDLIYPGEVILLPAVEP